ENGGHGGSAAAPLAREIFAKFFEKAPATTATTKVADASGAAGVRVPSPESRVPAPGAPAGIP
ncbi:MAG TPA: hypothetical protein VK416_04965, partial [Thermoanaerobaculia bacterium]|nr:hypothetical protein [Thermoanaerobaculia bacterium]